IAADPTRVWHSNRVAVDTSAVPGAKTAAPPPAPRATKLQTRARPPDGPGWFHEMQIEGRRLIARASLGGGVDLYGELGKHLTSAVARRHETIANALRLLPAQNLIVDGVATALYPDGRSRARGLGEALAGEGPATLAYYLTDLLYLDGTDLSATP